MTPSLPTLIETYDSDEFSLYGLWRLEIDGVTHDVGCVIGVPPCDRGSAAASGAGNRPFLSAWYADSSDWSCREERDAALDIIGNHVTTLAIAHGVA